MTTSKENLDQIVRQYEYGSDRSPKVISLLSSGLDSTLATWRLAEAGLNVIPMFVDYGQYQLETEKKSFSQICDMLTEEFPVAMDPPLFQKIDLYPTREPHVGSLWGRGIIFVGLAAAWSYIHGDDVDFIALGNHSGDIGPDCKPGEFDKYLDLTLRSATKDKMSIILPVGDLTNEQIGIELATHMDLRIPCSCYWDPQCGFRSDKDLYRCPGCRRKAIAMKAAGYSDKDVDRPSGPMGTSYKSPLAPPNGY